jgi:NAD(P)H dehydrogenase (quinone)
MKVLVVHAHHEPRSFSSALKDRLVARLSGLGHEVVVSDLYAMGFDPVSDRRNFTSVKRADYLKQQEEERHASEVGGFAAALAAEMEKLLAADLLVFNFPMWWFGLPAILKGWVDRVVAMGRMYGGPLFYENGIGRGKRAMVVMTTGGPAVAYGKWGLNPPLEAVLRPIQHGIFWFLGFAPLPPFVVYGPAHLGEDERRAKLDELEAHLGRLETLRPLGLPRRADFESYAHPDGKPRFMVEARRKAPPDARYRALVPAETARVAELEAEGKLLFLALAEPADPDWVGWLYFRAASRDEVVALLATLPLHDFLDFTIREAARV